MTIKTVKDPTSELHDVPLDPEIAVAQPVSAGAAHPVATPVYYPQPGVQATAVPPGSCDVKTYTIPPPGAAPVQYTVSPNLYERQLARNRNRNCLIGGSVAITAAVICCICFLLPIIIFLIAYFEMNRSYSSMNDSMNNNFGY